MKCPYCTHAVSRVKNKRNAPVGVRRRRECVKCQKRFTTYEKVGQSIFYIIKKDKRREKFDREKLEGGIHKAFEKRPIEKKKIDKMIHEIEETLGKKGKKELKSSIIGELVMRKIKKLDHIAYIRFASIYRDFQDIKELKKEIKGL